MHIFFTDLDNTLLNKHALISPRTKEAIDSYIAAGHKFVISSGRPLSSIFGVMERTGLDQYQNLLIISNNGSLVYDMAAKKPMIHHTMPLEDVKYLIDYCDQKGIHAHTYNTKNVCTKRPDRETDFYLSRTKMTAEYNEDVLSLLDQEPFKVVSISLDDKQRLFDLRESLRDWMEGKYTSIFSCEEFLEFFDARSGKGEAVKEVCRQLGIPVSEAYAAGDAENDRTMLEAAGHSIAMLNATDEIKSIASMITTRDHDHDGLADILFELSTNFI